MSVSMLVKGDDGIRQEITEDCTVIEDQEARIFPTPTCSESFHRGSHYSDFSPTAIALKVKTCAKTFV